MRPPKSSFVGTRPWRRLLPDLVQQADLRVFRRISTTHHPAGDTVLPWLSRAANHSRLWVAVAVLLGALGGRYGRRAALRGMVAIGGASFAANVPAKLAVNRMRPQLEVPVARRLVRLPTSTSFPSGHSASAFAFATGVALEIPRLAPAVFPIAAAVGYSRVYTGVHYPSDVVAGAVLGSAVALATRRWWPAAPVGLVVGVPTGRVRIDTVGPEGHGVSVVVNPASGSPLGPRVADEVRRALPDAEVIEIAEGGDLASALRLAAGSCRVLGIAGGDGSVNTAAAVAMEADKPLLVIPAGTLNHFAGDLGIGGFDDAIAAVLDGSAVRVDVAAVDGEVFVNTAAIGAYVDMVEAREQLERRIGKWPAMLVALVDILRTGRPVAIELDGRATEAWMVFFGNCRYSPEGFAPSTRPQLDDGLVDVRVVHASHPFSRLRLVWAVLSGTLAGSGVYEARVSEGPIRVRSLDGPLTLTRDGETFDGSSEFTVRKRSNRLVVIAPEAPDGAPVAGRRRAARRPRAHASTGRPPGGAEPMRNAPVEK